MIIHDKAKLCVGCRFDWYNGKNPHGIKQCWFLEGAKIVEGRLSCHEAGETFLPAKVEYHGFNPGDTPCTARPM